MSVSFEIHAEDTRESSTFTNNPGLFIAGAASNKSVDPDYLPHVRQGVCPFPMEYHIVFGRNLVKGLAKFYTKRTVQIKDEIYFENGTCS